MCEWLTKHFFNVIMASMQVTELPFFATKVRIGRSGIEEIYPLGPLNAHERLTLLLYYPLSSFSFVESPAIQTWSYYETFVSYFEPKQRLLTWQDW